MTAPHRTVQSKSAPVTVSEDVSRVGWKADHSSTEDVLGRKAGHIVAAEDRLPIVTEWSGMEDWRNAPPSYDVFFKQYMSYTHTMCYRFGVARDVEDVAQSIMTRFMERDSLGVFTPSWGSQSASGRSNFRSYYSRFILTYVTGLKRNAARHAARHLLVFDAPIDEGGTTWADVQAPSHEDDYGRVEFEEAIAALRSRVDPGLVDAVLMLAQDGPVKQGDLREVLGVKLRTAKTGLESVRAALRDVLADAG